MLFNGTFRPDLATPRIQRMAHIYIYSPSTAVQDPAAFKRGVKRLQAMGHEVELDEAVLARSMRFAGDDAIRLGAIGRAAASKADIAMISRGGYGITRLLAQLPYKAIAKSIDRGTQWLGLSDFTALQLALLAKTGAKTWAGPCLCEDFLVENDADLDDITMVCFDDLVMGRAEGAGWRLPKRENLPHCVSVPANAIKNIASKSIKLLANTEFHIKNATLWGGNLCVLTALVGTPYLPAVKGGVLFLEDTGEHPYKIERMLSTLLHAGVLSQQKAILMGQFSRITPLVNDRGYKLQTVVEWLRTQVKCPVLTGLPMGHVPTKVCLPVGAQVELALANLEALIVWGD